MRRDAATGLDPAGEGGRWQRYGGAVRAHVEAWAPILRACGTLPGE